MAQIPSLGHEPAVKPAVSDGPGASKSTALLIISRNRSHSAFIIQHSAFHPSFITK